MANELIHRGRLRAKVVHMPPPKYAQPKIEKTSTSKSHFWQILVIAVVSFLVFSPALRNDFTNWDDKSYIFNNPFLKKPLDLSLVKEIFFHPKPQLRYWMGNYHPLTMLSLTVNYHMVNDNGEPVAWIFILTNILLHVLNSVLVYLIVRQLFREEFLAFGVGLLFGVHTLHVESVAWISERKDVLYSFFYLLAFWFYVKYVDKRKWWMYLVSLLMFLLSLFSKGQAVSLSLSIILVDFIRRRKDFLKAFLEKVPFLGLSLVFGLIAIEAQKYGLALSEVNFYPLYKRIGIAAYAFGQYILKLILPVNLAAIYPYPDIINKTIPWYYYVYLLPDLLLVVGAIWMYFRRQDVVAFGVLFFVVNIVFLLQLIPVGSAIYADRYSYIPSIGIFMVFVYLFSLIKIKSISYSLFGLYVGLLSLFTVERVQVWRDSLSLWLDTVKKSPKAVVAWNNLGSVYSEKADQAKKEKKIDLAIHYYKEAIRSYERAIEGKPDYSTAFYNLATANYELFNLTLDSSYLNQALIYANKAIANRLDFTEAFLQRGIIYDHLGKEDLAYRDYLRVLELEPNNTKAIVNLGTYFGKKGQYQKAIEYFKKVIRLKRAEELAAAYANLGLAYYHLGKLDSALYFYDKSLELAPNAPFTHYNKALVYKQLDSIQLAINELTKAISLMPKNPDFYYYRAHLFLELNSPENACKDLQVAANLNHPIAKKEVSTLCQTLK